MSTAQQGIDRELSWVEVISKTFDLYRRNFLKYFILFLVLEAITGVLNWVATRAIVVPTMPLNPTPAQVLSSLSGVVAGSLALAAVSILLSLVFYPIAAGSAITMAADDVTKGRTDLGAAIRRSASKLISLWVVGIIVAIIVILGFIALIVPGIILAIMFSLAVPVIIIENAGALDSMGRSRVLVGQRWLKTFAISLVLGVIIIIAALFLGLISAYFGSASSIVNSALSAFYAPLVPIFLTVYYYSNLARITPPQTYGIPTTPPPMYPAGGKFCLNCGKPLASGATFCPNCGTRQPA